MKLSVYVGDQAVATLESVGDFKSVLTYHTGTPEDRFVALTMPVRTESYVWDDQLPPVLQMNLPEGYLLQVLQEQFGPHVGARPTALLAVIGRNMIGRLKVAAPGAVLEGPPRTIEVAELLHGDNSEAAFAELVRRHATSGVSGVVPKFLDEAEERRAAAPRSRRKISFITRRHIVKGSGRQFPFVALNEHLCMQVVARVMPAARTQVSDDGQALVVDRFDVDRDGQPHWGMEDFCALLGLRPAAKYDTNWERIAKAVRHHVPIAQRADALRNLACTLLLTYALRNADCHAKNLALLYTNRADVHLAPAYDMLTTNVYAGVQHNPPALSFMGKKTWAPGRSVQNFIAQTFDVPPREQSLLVEQISDAVAAVAMEVRAAMKRHRAFAEIGKRMLLNWSEGVAGLRDQRVYALGDWRRGKAFDGLEPGSKLASGKVMIGRSSLLSDR